MLLCLKLPAHGLEWCVCLRIRLWLFRNPGGDHLLGGAGVYLGGWQDQILQEEPHC